MPKLTTLLSDDNWRLRTSAAVALGKIGPEASPATPRLVELLQDSDAQVRDAAETSLTQMPLEADTTVPALTKLLKVGTDPSSQTNLPPLHHYVCSARWARADKNAVPAIVVIAQDERRYERYWAIIAFGEIGPAAKEAVPTLAKLTGEKNLNDELLLCLVKSMEKIGPSGPVAVNPISRLTRRTPAIRKEAELAWDLLGPGDIPSIKALVQCKNLSDRSMAASKLGDIGKAAVPAPLDR